MRITWAVVALWLAACGDFTPPLPSLVPSAGSAAVATSTPAEGGAAQVLTKPVEQSGGYSATAVGGSSVTEATGGAPNSGSTTVATGGLLATGGTSAIATRYVTTGGATGGTVATGGTTATGDTKSATGGSSVATGGLQATGGSVATGGTTAATGGTKAAAGASGTLVAAAGCASMNYEGAPCERYNDPADPSKCLQRHLPSTPAKCIKVADDACRTHSAHDWACSDACLICMNASVSTQANQACNDAIATIPDHNVCVWK